MCGLAGIVSDHKVSECQFQRMLDRLSHRGPDEEGIYKSGPAMLGIRRLSIVDMERGKQPLCNDSGEICIVFNGEIYNYLEIRRELEGKYRFRTDGDTEVVLRAYEEWGEGCVHHFNGMFVFVILDREKIFVARDRIGKKPVYYHHRDGLFVFASEIKALLAIVETKPQFSEHFMVFENVLAEETLFHDIYALPRSSTLVYENDAIRVQKYWDIEREPDYSLSEGYCVEKLRWLMEDAVRIRCQRGMQIGCLLSGGLDSSIVTCLAKPEHVFICHFPYGEKYDELHYAELVADYVGTEKHIVRPSENDFQELFPWINYMLDQPVGTAATIAEFLLNREAKRHVKVVLNGLGIDEFFGGYVRHLMMVIENEIVHNPMLRNYRSLAQYFWGDQMFAPPHERYFHLLRRGQPTTDEPLRLVERCFAKFRDVINQVSYTDFQISLPGLLMMTDRAASAFGIEARSPFLDYRIVEFSYEIPPQFKIKSDRMKCIVRKAARGIVPDAILQRRDKMGFSVPVNHWLSGCLRSWSDDLIEKLSRRGYNSSDGEKPNRGEFDRHKYQSVSFELWHEQFFN